MATKEMSIPQPQAVEKVNPVESFQSTYNPEISIELPRVGELTDFAGGTSFVSENAKYIPIPQPDNFKSATNTTCNYTLPTTKNEDGDFDDDDPDTD